MTRQTEEPDWLAVSKLCFSCSACSELHFCLLSSFLSLFSLSLSPLRSLSLSLSPLVCVFISSLYLATVVFLQLQDLGEEITPSPAAGDDTGLPALKSPLWSLYLPQYPVLLHVLLRTGHLMAHLTARDIKPGWVGKYRASTRLFLGRARRSWGGLMESCLRRRCYGGPLSLRLSVTKWGAALWSHVCVVVVLEDTPPTPHWLTPPP